MWFLWQPFDVRLQAHQKQTASCINNSADQIKCFLQETAVVYLEDMTRLYQDFKDGFNSQTKESIAKGKVIIYHNKCGHTISKRCRSCQ